MGYGRSLGLLLLSSLLLSLPPSTSAAELRRSQPLLTTTQQQEPITDASAEGTSAGATWNEETEEEGDDVEDDASWNPNGINFTEVTPEQSRQQLLDMMAERGINLTELAHPEHPMHSMLDVWLPHIEPRVARALGIWMGAGRLPPPPTGKAAAASALVSMARAGKYRNWLRTLDFSGWRPTMQNYIQRTPATVLACTDQAWTQLNPKYQKMLKTNKKVATKFIQFHMLQQLWPAAALAHWKNTSPYPNFLSLNTWRIRHPSEVPFASTRNDPKAQWSWIVGKDISGRNLRLIIVEGMNRCLVHPRIFV